MRRSAQGHVLHCRNQAIWIETTTAFGFLSLEQKKVARNEHESMAERKQRTSTGPPDVQKT